MLFTNRPRKRRLSTRAAVTSLKRTAVASRLLKPSHQPSSQMSGSLAVPALPTLPQVATVSEYNDENDVEEQNERTDGGQNMGEPGMGVHAFDGHHDEEWKSQGVQQHFAESFWGEGDKGLEVITRRLKDGKTTLRSLLEVITAKASLEEDYGKKLGKIAKAISAQTECGTIREALVVIREELENLSRTHIDMSVRLRSELELPLNELIASQRDFKHSVLSMNEKNLRAKQLHTSSVLKARDRFHARSTEANQLRSLQSSTSGKEHERVRSKLEKADQALKAADTEYQKTSENLLDLYGVWEREWRIALGRMERLETKRLQTTRAVLQNLVTISHMVLPANQKFQDQMMRCMQEIHVQKDLGTFVSMNATGQDAPAIPQYNNDRPDGHYGPPMVTGPGPQRGNYETGDAHAGVGNFLRGFMKSAKAGIKGSTSNGTLSNPIGTPSAPPPRPLSDPTQASSPHGVSEVNIHDSGHAAAPSFHTPVDQRYGDTQVAPSMGGSPYNAKASLQAHDYSGYNHVQVPYNGSTQPVQQSLQVSQQQQNVSPPQAMNSGTSEHSSVGDASGVLPPGTPLGNPPPVAQSQVGSRPHQSSSSQGPASQKLHSVENNSIDPSGPNPMAMPEPGGEFSFRPPTPPQQPPYENDPAETTHAMLGGGNIEELSPIQKPDQRHVQRLREDAAANNAERDRVDVGEKEPSTNVPAQQQPGPEGSEAEEPQVMYQPILDPSHPARVLFNVRALYDYTAQVGDELDFGKGASMAVLHTQEDGWWIAEVGDGDDRRRGLIPSNFVEVIPG